MGILEIYVLIILRIIPLNLCIESKPKRAIDWITRLGFGTLSNALKSLGLKSIVKLQRDHSEEGLSLLAVFLTLNVSDQHSCHRF